MGRFLTGEKNNADNNADKTFTDLLTNRVTPKSLFGQIKVPDGVKYCYVTGVAAGGRGYNTTLVSSGIGATTQLASSQLGHFVFGTRVDNAASPAVIIDPIGRKACPSLGVSNGNPPFASGSVGMNLVVADNGFAVATGGISAYGYSTKDGGLSWPADVPATLGTTRVVATAPIDPNDSVDKNRFCGVSSPTVLWAWNGISFEYSSVYTTANMSGLVNVNGYFVALSSSASDKTAIYVKDNDAATTPSNWPKVTVDAVNLRVPVDITYSPELGLYVLACSNGYAYTAPDINGPWIARNTGIVNIQGVKWAGGRFLAVGNGTVASSTDGINWSVGALDKCSWYYPSNVAYIERIGLWAALGGEYSNLLNYSADGITWNQSPAGGGTNTYSAIVDHPAGLVGAVHGSFSFLVIPDPSKRFCFAVATSDDGGPLRVLRASDYSELLYLCGGLSIGTGGTSTTIPGADSYDMTDGEMRPLDLMRQGTPATYGMKVPGFGGRAAPPAGGGSLFAPPVKSGRPLGPGAGGAGNGTYNGGGGGEGVVRFKIDVTPGEILLYSAGLPMANMGMTQTPSTSIFEPNHGYISFEFI